MPTKKDYIEALSLEVTAKEIKDEFSDKSNYFKNKWLAELESDTYADVRYYYYYWRRIRKNFKNIVSKTVVRGNDIITK